MKRLLWLVGAPLLIVSSAWLVVSGRAQTPFLDALDQQLIQIAFEAHAQAQKACETQPDTRHAQRLAGYVESMIKVKYPGYVIDWTNRKLMVPK